MLVAITVTPLKKLYTLGKKLFVGSAKTVGVTASWFVDVCDLAGLHYSQVRSFARKLIDEPTNTDFQRKRLNVLLNMTHGEDKNDR